ncbi:MAG TPA: hypothetical protein VK955_11305 [Xanthobacteraceae bacterium]|nr:hypothetical protein [Xanthobacteraceae bacterium]
MPRRDDGPESFWPARLAVIALILAGYGLTLLVFYPGVMTYDGKYVYEDIAKAVWGDWQSPAMIALWRFINPVAPGAASMFLLIITAYWLAFGLLAMAFVRRAILLAYLLPLLALTPPAFVFAGIIWRDVLFSVTWLLAGSIAFVAADRAAVARVPLQTLALALCGFGVLLRPNALIAAPLLAAYTIWPNQFSWKRTAILFLPAMAVFFGLVQVVYYGALGAIRQHPLQSIMVFDLGGISHFTRQNQFPVRWNEAETDLLLNVCYKPTEWDIYWTRTPCQFVMHKLETEEKVFGTPAVTSAWINAITHHPVAYLEHRTAFMWNFLAGSNLTMWLIDIEDTTKIPFPDRSAFVAVKNIHDALKPTPLFRAGSWLLVCIALCAVGWRRRDRPEGAYIIGVCGSAVVYVLTFYAVGVASDFRYGYWAVLASLTGCVVAAAGAITRRSAETAPSSAA